MRDLTQPQHRAFDDYTDFYCGPESDLCCLPRCEVAMEDAGGWARSLWGHCEVDKSIFERLRTECSMLGGGSRV